MAVQRTHIARTTVHTYYSLLQVEISAEFFYNVSKFVVLNEFTVTSLVNPIGCFFTKILAPFKGRCFKVLLSAYTVHEPAIVKRVRLPLGRDILTGISLIREARDKRCSISHIHSSPREYATRNHDQ